MDINNPILLGAIGGIITGLATGVGALPVLFFEKISDKTLDTALGFSAGVMLAASVFSLLVPAIELSNVISVSIAFLIGALSIEIIDMYMPHMHLIKGVEGHKSSLRKTWLFILAITLHNMPEGLAVGVSFGSGNLEGAITIMMAIALQNMPEGLGVAFPLMREKYSRSKALVLATLSGLVEPLFSVIGAAVVSISYTLLPLALAFAAGAMIYVISDEVIPESHTRGYEREATFGLLFGFIVMMMLDNLI